MADMQTPRDCFALVTCSGKLYAIAGCIDSSFRHTASGERYDPARDVWEYVAAKLPEAKCALAGVCVEM